MANPQPLKTESPKAKPEDEEKFPVVATDQYAAREYRNNVWDMYLPDEIAHSSAEKYLDDPRLYVNAPSHQPGMRSYDLIRAHNDHVWGEVLVREAIDGTIMAVQVLRVVALQPRTGENKSTVLDGFTFTFSQELGWIVRRKSDGVSLGNGKEKGWSSKHDAEAYVLKHPTVIKAQVAYTTDQ